MWFFFLLSLVSVADFRLTYQSDTLQAAVLSGSWYEIGKDASTQADLNPGDLFPVRVKTAFELALGNAFHSEKIGKLGAKWILRGYASSIFPEDKELLRGVAQGLRLTPRYMQQAFLTTEIQNFCVLKFDMISHFLSACSSFVTRDAQDEILFGHNMDFGGAGSLDRNLSVYLLKPKKTNSFRKNYHILSVSPRGIPLPGLASMNETGLTLSLHTAVHHIISTGKISPTLSVNRKVLEEASSIEEAMSIYHRYRYLSGWLVQIADRTRAGVIELTGHGPRFVPESRFGSALSNSYLSSQNRIREFQFSRGVAQHNQDRVERLQELLESERIQKKSGGDALQEAFQFLSDSFSPYSKRVVLFSPSGIRAIDQMFSVVFRPKSRELWIADRSQAPSSLGEKYIKFSFESMEKKDALFESLSNPSSTPLLSGLNDKENQVAKEALHEFVQAHVEEDQRGNSVRAYAHLKKAASLAKDCSFVLGLAGHATYFYSQTRKDEDLEIAKKSAIEATQCQDLSPHHRAIAFYIQGLTHLLTHKFTDATQSFEEAWKLESSVDGPTQSRPGPSLLQKIREFATKASTADLKLGILDTRLNLKMGDKIFGW